MIKYILAALVLMFIFFFQDQVNAQFLTIESHQPSKVFKLDNDYSIELVEKVIDKKVVRFLIVFNKDVPVMLKSCQEPKILNETDKQICNVDRIAL